MVIDPKERAKKALYDEMKMQGKEAAREASRKAK